jgi:hypothetical protein
MKMGSMFKLNYQLFWLTLTFFGWLVAVLVTVSVGWILAVIPLTLAALIFGAFVKSGFMPFVHRKGWSFVKPKIGWSRFKTEQPGLGELVTPEGTAEFPSKGPGKLIGKLEFRALAPSGEQDETTPTCDRLGVVDDPVYSSEAGVMWAAGSALSNMDPEDRQARIEAWSRILQLVVEMGPEIHRFVWQVQTIPGEPQSPTNLLEQLRSDANLGSQERPGQAEFAQQLTEMGKQSVQHITRLILAIDKGIAKPRHKRGTIDDVLHEKLRMLYENATGEGTVSLGIRAASFYSLDELRQHNRLVLDPVFMEELRARTVPPEVSADIAWPKSYDFSRPNACRVGSTWHIGFYLDQTPRKGVNSDSFWRLQELRVPKTTTTVVEPVSYRRALREAEFRSGGAEGANRDLVEAQRRVSMRQHRDVSDALAYEQELAEQTGQVLRLRRYFDVTGETLEAAETNAGLLLSASRQESLVLEPLIDRQEEGIQALLHAGRGLATITPAKLKLLLS